MFPHWKLVYETPDWWKTTLVHTHISRCAQCNHPQANPDTQSQPGMPFRQKKGRPNKTYIHIILSIHKHKQVYLHIHKHTNNLTSVCGKVYTGYQRTTLAYSLKKVSI